MGQPLAEVVPHLVFREQSYKIKTNSQYKDAKKSHFSPKTLLFTPLERSEQSSIIYHTPNHKEMKLTRFYIKERPLKDGTRSLFLCSTSNGKSKSISLGLYLEPHGTKEAKRNNEQKLMQARRILAKAELEQSDRVFQLPRFYQPLLLCEAWEAYQKMYHNKDLASVKATGKWVEKFCDVTGQSLYLHELNAGWCHEFNAFLSEHLKGGTPAAYFKKFKAFLEYQCRVKNLLENPAADIHSNTKDTLTKEVLTLDELQRLAQTHCHNPVVKEAFLFACNTGLRWCDIIRLRWEDYDIQHKTLNFVQHKVEGKSTCDTMHQPLNRNAQIILESIRHSTAHGSKQFTTQGQKQHQGQCCQATQQRIFDLPTYRTTLRHLDLWMEKAGIHKHITFHCARHTFITNLILLDTNIAMVAQLAGHSSTRHTERYIHLADKERSQAINRLPLYEF